MKNCAECEPLINELRGQIRELELENSLLTVRLELLVLIQDTYLPNLEIEVVELPEPKRVGRPKTRDIETEKKLLDLLSNFIAEEERKTGKKIPRSRAIDFFLKRIDDPEFKSPHNRNAVASLKKTLMNRLSELSKQKE